MTRVSTPLYLVAALTAFSACDDGATTDLESQTPENEQQGEAPDAEVAPPPTWCEGSVKFEYDPFAANHAQAAFPDDAYTIEGETTTGRVVSIEDDNAPWLADIPGNYNEVYRELNGLDGFGTSAAPFIRLSGGVVNVASGDEIEGLMLLDLGGPTAVEVPYSLEVADDGASLLLWPKVSMRQSTLHAVVMTNAVTDADGGCVAPSVQLRDLLTGSAEGKLDALGANYAALMEKSALQPGEVSAAVTFTTQTITAVSEAIAADIKGRDAGWSGPAQCRRDGQNTRCDRTFKAWDYRGEDGLIEKPEGQTEYDLIAATWLPRQGSGPWPVLIMGHGLGSSRDQAAILGAFADDYQVAVVAIDAVEHGAHPARKSNDPTISLTNFFGIYLSRQVIRARQLRDNFRQSSFDKLQLIETLISDPDVDDDGEIDLDVSRIGYFGVSLGGILGNEPLALSDDFEVAILSMAGGRMVASIRDSATFGPLISLMIPRQATAGDEARLFPVIQAVTDAGDGANYAPYLLRDRLQGDDARIPHTLFMVAVGDQVVPNSASHILAQAMGIPHMTPVKVALPLLEVIDADKISANMPGEITAGLFQFDKITPAGRNSLEIVEHETLPTSDEALEQLGHFVRTWVNDGQPEIINPWR
ncbi:MAG: hypothetical protein ACE366_12745 [Bradymonadia bacterium]